MTAAMHVLERVDSVRKLERSKNEWESGYWDMPEETAKKLIGSVLYFHRGKLQASHFGGSILSYRVEESGPKAGRIVFMLRADADRKGKKTDGKGWSKDYKIYWDAPVTDSV